MTRFLSAFARAVRTYSDRIAFKNSAGDVLTYSELEAKSNDFASYLVHTWNTPREVVLIGHKDPAMLIGILGAMKARCSYVPLDSSFPLERMERIVGQLERPLIVWAGELFDAPKSWDIYPAFDLAAPRLETSAYTAALSSLDDEVVYADNSADIAADDALYDANNAVDDALYILFTSGSTGLPKGVIQTRQTLDATMDYFEKFIPSVSASEGGTQNYQGSSNQALVFFNRTHFSFDVSVFDIAMALPWGHTLFALDETRESSLKDTFAALRESQLNVWISTPSFLNMCLTDPSFNRGLLPDLQTIIVCGEVLLKSTCERVFERFGDVALYNTYGPTETQAITDVLVTPELLNEEFPIPIGRVSRHNRIEIQNYETHRVCEANEPGEIVIFGDTIAHGYYHQSEKTAAAFGVRDSSGVSERFYRTGDEGFLDETGMLHYLGRFDLQVKINGYRVELGEIETALEQIEGIAQACVVPVVRSELSTHLSAFVVPEDTSWLDADAKILRQHTRVVKDAIKSVLPAYMLPRNYTWVRSFPSNVNGKIDRKALTKMAAGGRPK